MPKYDAFGREVGEDPLAGLRDAAAAPARTEPAGEDAVEPVATVTLTDGEPLATAGGEPRASTAFPEHRGMPRPPRPRRVGGAAARVVVAVIALGVLLPVGFGVYAVFDAVRDTVETVDEVVDTPIPGIPQEAQDALEEATQAAPQDASPAADPVGLQRGSMMTRAELARALGRLRPYGRVRLLRVAPARVDAQMVTSSGTMRMVQVRPGGAAQVLATVDGGGGGPALVSLAQINPAAPFRLTRSAAGRLRRPTTQVDYAVMLSLGGTAQWSVYFRGGRAFQGDALGRVVRRIQ